MATLILYLQYDGTYYSGWQIQKNALTVQQVVETAIEKVTSKYYSSNASGRTDAGVHARCQVVSVKIGNEFTLPESKITVAINSKLPRDVRVIYAKIYDGYFNARHDAAQREYEYLLSTVYNPFDRLYVSHIKYPINKDLLFASAELFLGKHDFTTFSKFNPDNKKPVCDVTYCSWEGITQQKFKLTIRANHFLYGMVRSIAGAMIEIARGKRTFDEISAAFEKKDRLYNSALAPPQGLYLNKVYYPEKFGLL